MDLDLMNSIQHRVAQLRQPASDKVSGQRPVMADDTNSVVSGKRDQESAVLVAEGPHGSSDQPCRQLAGEMPRLLACDLSSRRQRSAGGRSFELGAISERKNALVR